MKKPKRKAVTKDDRRRAWAIGIARKETNQATSDRFIETHFRDIVVASIVAYQCTRNREDLRVRTNIGEVQALLRQLDRARLAVLRPE